MAFSDLLTLPYIILALLAVLIFLVNRFFGITKDDSEPPFVPSRIPYFGHLAGILFKRTSYIADLSTKYAHPIFSLATPGGRLYVVTSPELIAAVQKQPRTLTFWFIQATLTQRLGGITDHANQLLLENARGEKGENSLVVDGMKVTHEAMTSKHLHEMISASLKRAEKILQGVGKGETSEFELWKWVRHVFSLAVSAGVYGPQNPYEDPTLEQDLQDYAKQTLLFLTGLPPHLLVPKAFAARERIVKAFETYFENKGYETGSEMTRARRNILQTYGIYGQDIARMETVNGFGILLNLLPTAFWTIWHIISDRDLLKNARKEAEAYLQGNDDWDSGPGKAEEDLPLMASTMREVLRCHVAGAATRMVMEDHFLNGKYLLKKDSMIQMPNSVPHFDKNEWGPNADQFDAYRFVRQEGKKPHPVAFRSWGGGANLCPGRVYAPRLILTVTAMLIRSFDISPAETNGRWEHPGQDTSNPAIVVVQPQKRTMVRVSPRESF